MEDKEMNEWIEANNNLPKENGEYIVCLCYTHHATAYFDFWDLPCKEYRVTMAYFDTEQKIWSLDKTVNLNALLSDNEQPSNGYSITHWMELPPLPEGFVNPPKIKYV